MHVPSTFITHGVCTIKGVRFRAVFLIYNKFYLIDIQDRNQRTEPPICSDESLENVVTVQSQRNHSHAMQARSSLLVNGKPACLAISLDVVR